MKIHWLLTWPDPLCRNRFLFDNECGARVGASTIDETTVIISRLRRTTLGDNVVQAIKWAVQKIQLDYAAEIAQKLYEFLHQDRHKFEADEK